MKTATTHEAKTHLSRLIREAQSGETVVILSGKTPVAKLTAISEADRSRPHVGTVTSDPVTWAEDAFAPMTQTEIEQWGL